jgi:hypothetical protein
MSSSPRALPLLAALLLGLAAAFLVACGSGTKRGIPAANAQQLNNDLDALASAVNAGNCATAAAALVKVRGDVLELPASVSQRLRKRLTQGADNLAQRAPGQCTANEATTPTDTTPTTTDTTPTDTTPTTTDTTPTDTTPTTTDTTPTDTTPTDTTPTTTTPTTSTHTSTTPTTPGGTGGATPGTKSPGSGGTGAGG